MKRFNQNGNYGTFLTHWRHDISSATANADAEKDKQCPCSTNVAFEDAFCGISCQNDTAKRAATMSTMARNVEKNITFMPEQRHCYFMTRP